VLTPAPEIVRLLAPFASAFTRPTFEHALVLVTGTILASGRRTVAAALRAVGRRGDRHFTTYHRVLNRARWSPLALSRRLLELLVRTCLAPAAPLVLLVDGTLERRSGRRIAAKGRFYDAVRSRPGHVATSEGVHWLCVMLLVPVPWSRRPWALPFLSVPTLTPAASAALGKRHRTVPERTATLVRLLRRWQPERELVLVGDSSFAVVELAQVCRQQRVALVAPLLLNAQLYDPPAPRPASTPGPKPKKGPRQPTLAARVAEPATVWQPVTLPWYGGRPMPVDLASGTARWHTDGHDPVPLRWVLVRRPDRRRGPLAFFCTEPTAAAEPIVRWYVDRWAIEVTFEEVRAHLGVETQRQWSTPAIGRTTPCLLGLFSVVVLLAQTLHPRALPVRTAAWYPKADPTFTDVLAVVRRHLWLSANRPPRAADSPGRFPDHLFDTLIEAACYAA
jgi:hypothetical protein